MTVYPQVLPTITQILALEHLDYLDVERGAEQAVAPGRSPECRTPLSEADRQAWHGGEAMMSEARSPLLEPPHTQAQAVAETQWTGAIATLNQLLNQYLQQAPVAVAANCDQAVQGLVLSSPVPVISTQWSAGQLANWVLRPEPLENIHGLCLQLPPGDRRPGRSWSDPSWTELNTLPLVPHDPLATEQFCLVFTPEFNLAFVLGQDGDRPVFEFSFDPHLVKKAWQAIQLRLAITSPQMARHIHHLVQALSDVEPDYRVVSRFSRGMARQLAEAANQRPTSRDAIASPSSLHPPTTTRQATPTASDPRSDGQPAAVSTSATETSPPPDTELLQVMAHEIRTPLTTIRTLTRSLLRRQDLDAKVTKRLQQIDRECTRQIDRFSLIFRAAELESQRSAKLGGLCATALDQVFRDNIHTWQQQANQRQIQLDVVVPPGLPLVVSDPTMLTQTLTGLVDRFTHSLPAGSHLQFDVTLAGNQLKLQFTSSLQAESPTATQSQGMSALGELFNPNQAFKAIGQLLMVQPETGNLSLNLAATKNLFQALGGKLIVKQRPEQGEVMTIFLPLSPPDSKHMIV